MLNVLGGVAQFERETIPEREREGIAEAKAEGANGSRKPTARARTEEVRALTAEGLRVGAVAARARRSDAVQRPP